MSDNDASTATKIEWKAMSMLAAAAGGMIARKVVGSLWTSLVDDDVEPPLNPADRRIDWSTALGWTVAAGVAAGVGRLVSQRAAAAGWEAATGDSPPSMG